MKKWLILLKTLLLALCLLRPAWAADVPADTFLWKISKSNAPTSYLIGTVHLGKQGSTLAPEYRDILAQTPRLVVETQVESEFFQTPAGMLRVMLMMNMAQSEQTLVQSLGKARNAKLQRIVRRYATSSERDMLSSQQKWQPWFVMMSLEQMFVPKGYNDDYGIDSLLLKAARATGKEVDELEGVEVLKYYADIPEDVILRAIDASLANPQEQVALSQHLFKLYREHRATELWAEVKSDKHYQMFVPQDREIWKNMMFKQLLKERNTQWMPKLEKLLSERANTVAVGAAHLFGEHGLIALLRQQGYTVEPIMPKRKTNAPS